MSEVDKTGNEIVKLKNIFGLAITTYRGLVSSMQLSYKVFTYLCINVTMDIRCLCIIVIMDISVTTNFVLSSSFFYSTKNKRV